MVKCYVGEWHHRPVGVCIDPSVFNMAHPRDFSKVLEEHIKERDEVNIWTNNTRAVACFPAKDVMVCCLTERGRVVCKPLTAHPQYEKWMDEFDSGEFWSFVGEKWVLEDSE